MANKSRDLILPVKRIYFDAILEGSKLFEYRKNNEHWRKRIEGRTYDRIIITLGYPAASDREKHLVLPWNGYENQTFMHEHFGNEPVNVFAIPVNVLARLDLPRS